MAGTLYGLGYFPLEFQGSTGEAAGQHLALVIDELQQEVCVFVIDVFDAILFKTAVLLTVVLHFGGSYVLDLFICHYSATSSALGASSFLLKAPLRFFSL